MKEIYSRKLVRAMIAMNVRYGWLKPEEWDEKKAEFTKKTGKYLSQNALYHLQYRLANGDYSLTYHLQTYFVDGELIKVRMGKDVYRKIA